MSVVTYTELYMNQYSTFNEVVRFIDDNGVAVNVTNHSISCQMRDSYYSANASANITCSPVNAANGEVRLLLSKANTANLTPGKYLFDVVSTDTLNVATRRVEGVIIVVPGVTR